MLNLKWELKAPILLYFLKISHNRHYVKWMVNWWKILVFKIANKRLYVK